MENCLFHQNRNENTEQNCTCKCTCESQRKKRKVDYNEKSKENDSSEVNDKDNEKERIIDHVKKLISKYSKTIILSCDVIEKDRATFLKKVENLAASYENSNLIKVKCFMDDCSTLCRITNRPLKNGGVNWVTSNFNRHLSKVHYKKSTSEVENRPVNQRDIRSFNFKVKNKKLVCPTNTEANSCANLANSSIT